MTIFCCIRVCSKQGSISQEQLAMQSGMSRATLSKIENGHIANTNIVKINHILSLLGYELDIKLSNLFILL